MPVTKKINNVAYTNTIIKQGELLTVVVNTGKNANFYPITALMIIFLALLNDIPILAIAYDNTRLDQRLVRWKMSELLSISSTLSIAGVVSSFALLFIFNDCQENSGWCPKIQQRYS